MGPKNSDFPVGGKALLIAVESNSIQGYGRLYRAHHDAETLKLLLIERYGYQEKNITLMKDHVSHAKHLQPTKKNIRKQIRVLVKGVSAGDRLFFSYSGHGCQMSCYDHTETDGLDEAIYTCNKQVIVDNDLKKWLVKPLPQGCKLFALFDSCHSRTILDLDHYYCNELEGCRSVQSRHASNLQSMGLLQRVLLKGFRNIESKRFPRKSFTSPTDKFLNQRVATQASTPVSVVSAGGSMRLSSKWFPFLLTSSEVRRVLSPTPYFACDGKCALPTEADKQCARVISLSACRDNEIAVDDSLNGTFTKFFVDHLMAEPKSSLRELLVAIRKGVDEITAAYQAYQDAKTRAAAQRIALTNGPGSRIQWIPPVIHRNIEVDASSPEEFLRLTPSTTRDEQRSIHSQQPSYSSQYRLDLDEPVDL